MGDTAIQWAIQVAEILYYSEIPPDSPARYALSQVAIGVLREHYHPSLEPSRFMDIVANELEELVAKDPNREKKIGRSMLPDTFLELEENVLEWLVRIGEVAYFTNAYSPRSERMRKDIVHKSFRVHSVNICPTLHWDTYWEAVVAAIRAFQMRSQQLYQNQGIRETGQATYSRTIEDLFDINRTD